MNWLSLPLGPETTTVAAAVDTHRVMERRDWIGSILDISTYFRYTCWYLYLPAPTSNGLFALSFSKIKIQKGSKAENGKWKMRYCMYGCVRVEDPESSINLGLGSVEFFHFPSCFEYSFDFSREVFIRLRFANTECCFFCLHASLQLNSHWDGMHSWHLFARQ